jgi:hypothetical protein
MIIKTGGGTGLPQDLEQQIGAVLSGQATIEVVAKDEATFTEKLVDHAFEAVVAIVVACAVAYFTRKWLKKEK